MKKKLISTLFLVLSCIIFMNYSLVLATDSQEIIDETEVTTDDEQEEIYDGIRGEQSAEDGTYKIMSILNTNKVFDIASSSTANGVQVLMWESNKGTNQKFEIKYAGEGFYKIESNVSKKVLTVESEEPTVGSKITQEDDNDLDTQKWILKKYSESIYYIISKCGNLYMELPDTVVSNGQKLQLGIESDSNQQRFVMVNQTPESNLAEIKDGIYQLESNNSKVLDVASSNQNNGANVLVYKNKRNQNQKFRITRVGNTNYYKVTAVHSAKALDVTSAKEVPGANVIQFSSKAADNQYWLFKDCGNGYYNIISKHSGLYLDIFGSNVELNYNNQSNTQKFKLRPINIIHSDTYEIETKLDSSKVVDISGASTKNGGNAVLWTAKNASNERFVFEPLLTDTYKIVAKHSNKVLTVDKKTNNVYQSTYTGENNQKWQVIETGGGYYNLVSKDNGLALAIAGGKNKNGQNIQVEKVNGSNAKKFRFVTGFRKFYEEGTYGKSGLAVKGDKRGTDLKYYKIGRGSKVLFAAFSIHGFEDSYNHDGAELTYIAEEFKTYLKSNITEDIVNKYTIYILPCLNPDGQTYGTTNNGPGRTTLYSAAPNHKGIDMNRTWSVGYIKQTSTRNYNGTVAFQAYEARYLRDFILKHQGTSNILVDTHGWLNETMGDNALGKYYRNKFGLPKHIDAYGKGYLINWARTLKKGRSTLVELPEVSSHSLVVNRNYAKKWINATMKMLKEN